MGEVGVSSGDVAGMITYESLGVRRVINASGRMTALGGVALHRDVTAAMAEAAGIVNLSRSRCSDAATWHFLAG